MRPRMLTCWFTREVGLSLSWTLMTAVMLPAAAVILALARPWPLHGGGVCLGSVSPKNASAPSTPVSGGATAMALADTFVFTLKGGGRSLARPIPGDRSIEQTIAAPR